MGRRKKRKLLSNPKRIQNIAVDHKKIALEKFMKENQNQKMWLTFDQYYFMRVRVIKAGPSSDYENVQVKLLETNKRMKESTARVKIGDKKYLEIKKLKKFKKFFVNHLSLHPTKYMLVMATKNLKSETERYFAIKHSLKYCKEAKEYLSEIINKFSK